MFKQRVRVPDPSTAEDFGNGFLMRHGWTVAWVAWQHDVPRRDGMMASTSRGPRMSGLVRCEFQPNTPTDVRPLADRYHFPYAAAELDDPAADAGARARRRPAGGDPAQRVAVRAPGERALVPDACHVHLEGGFVLATSTTSSIDPRIPVVGGCRSSACVTRARS
jgi:hypothetical protein